VLPIGHDFISGADSIFIEFITTSVVRRNKLEQELLLPCLRGENVRNWMALWHGNRKGEETFTIYTLKPGEADVVGLKDYPMIERFLGMFKEALAKRADGWTGQTLAETGAP
jgi:hypothetical protein